jgi:WD40 repeat protein
LGYRPTLSEDGLQIHVTARASSVVSLETIIYPVGDLVSSDGANKNKEPDYTSLMRAIQNHVAVTSWGNAGGPGNMTVVKDAVALSVSQTWWVHVRVHHYLNDLRRLRAAAAKKPRTVVEKMKQLAVPIPPDIADNLLPSQITKSQQRLQQLKQKLSTPVEGKFAATPLADVLKVLQQQTAVELTIDQAALDQAKIRLDVTVDRVLSKTTLGKALQQLLNPLQLEMLPIFHSDDVELRVTTRSVARAEAAMVVYSLQDISLDPDLPSVSRYDLLADGIEAMTTSPPSGTRTAEDRALRITRHVQDFAVSVRDSWEVHLAIDDWLEERRRHFKQLPAMEVTQQRTAATVIARLQARFEQCSKTDALDHETTVARRLLVEFARLYPGTSEALRARELLHRLPSPVDTLRRADMDPYELAVAGSGDANTAPREIVAIFGDSRFNHWQPVTSVAFHPDGAILASGSHDSRITIWDPRTGRQARTLSGHGASVQGIAFSPDGKILASASADRMVILWDAASGARLRTLSGHDGIVHAVVFLSDGQVASGCSDNTIRVWDVGKGETVRTIEAPSSVLALALDRPSGLLASGLSSGAIELWNTKDFSRTKTLTGHSGGTRALTFSSAAKLLASGGADGTVRLWDPVAGKQQAQFRPGVSDAVRGLAFSPNGAELAIEGPGFAVGLWNVDSGEAIRALQRHGDLVLDIAFSADGKFLASAGGDGTVRIASVASPALPKSLRRQSLPKARAKPVNWAVAGGEDWGDKGRSNVDRTAYFSSVDISPDGLTIAASGGDRRVRIWDVGRRAGHVLGRHEAWGHCVTFGPYSHFVATAANEGSVWTWSLLSRSGQQIVRYSQPIRCARYSPNGLQLACAVASEAQVFGGAGRMPLSGHTERIRWLDFSPDSGMLATASEDKTVRIWDVAMGKVLHVLPHEDHVRTVAFSPDGKTLASGSRDRVVKLWDVDTGQPKGPTARHNFSVSCVTYRPDGRQLASSGYDGAVRLWDAETLKPQAVLQLGPKQGEIRQVVYTPDGRHLVTANANGTVYVLSLDEAGKATK